MKIKRFFAWILVLIVGLLAAGSAFSTPVATHADTTYETVNVYYFTTSSCPHCAALETFLEETKAEKPHLNTTEYDIAISENLTLLEEVAGVFAETNVSTPFIVVGGKHYVGFSNTTKARLSRIIDKYQSQEHVDIMAKILAGEPILESDFDRSSDYEYDLPIIGVVDVRSVSLGLIAFVLGLIDGVNPCAMWVLIFLITLVLGSDNKKRIWIIGGTFILISGLFYFGVMMAWLETVRLLIAVKAFQIIFGILAVLAGGYNIYNFIKALKERTDGCEVTDVSTKQKLVERVKKIAMSSSLPLAILGVVVLALLVNVIELACSTGLPLVFSQILALNGIAGAHAVGYILLYILAFLIDDLLIFGVAVFTFKVSPLSSKLGKYAHLVGGILMVALGVLMIFFPSVVMFSF
ncbi:MAG: hypothetical protein ACOX3K_03855 [Bacilli bacterium]|jgi:glutaredoxin